MEGKAKADFRSMVDAVRAGTIFAQDNAQYQRWSRQSGRPLGPMLKGADLERAIMNVARMFPGNVEFGRA